MSGNPAQVNLNAQNKLLWQVWSNDSVYTGPVNCTLTLKNANGTQLSFAPATIQTQTTIQAAGGILQAPVYGGAVKATGATITAQVENTQSAPSTVDIAFR